MGDCGGKGLVGVNGNEGGRNEGWGLEWTAVGTCGVEEEEGR